MTTPAATKRTELTLASARCFNIVIDNKFNYRVVKIFKIISGAVIFLCLILINACYAELKIAGDLPEWLNEPVKRSLSAVWAEIPDDENIDKLETLRLVASRLFTGYKIEAVNFNFNNKDININFYKLEDVLSWQVKLIEPELRGMALNWFNKDIAGLDAEILKLINNLPVEALSWADAALKDAIKELINNKLAGWDFNAQVNINNNINNLNIYFRPAQPLVLAVRPSLYSRTIPVMFKSDLEAKLIPGLSPLIGLPVAWAEQHRLDIEMAAQNFLKDRNSVDNMRASANVKFKPAAEAALEAKVDSDRFLFQVWVAAYAGIKDKYPEAGVFFGWNMAHLFDFKFKFNLELYAEALVELSDWDFTGRLGARYELFNDFWAGVEGEWPHDLMFARIYWGSYKPKRFYAWWRVNLNESSSHEGAVGYRLDDHIAIEIYYDGIKGDKLGLRGQWSL